MGYVKHDKHETSRTEAVRSVFSPDKSGRKLKTDLTASVLEVSCLSCLTYPFSFCQIGQLFIFTPYRMKKPDKSGRKFEIALTATVLNGSPSSFHQVSW